MTEQPIHTEPLPDPRPHATLTPPKTKRVYIIRGPRSYYQIKHDKDEAKEGAKILSLLNKGHYYSEVK